jgi:PTS system, IIA component
VYNGLVEREQQGTTGMMDGFAIPHAKSSAITTPKIVIVRLNEGIDWNSMDGNPTLFIFSLLIPDGEAGTTHLKLLATVARMLMKADVKEALLSAKTAEQLEEVLNSHLGA